MKVAALISGGKDSCFSMMQCIAAGHEIVALANLYPVGKDELDSFMFQTVGHQGVEFIGEAMGLPLYREPTSGESKMQEKNYLPTEDDEVEDLYRLIKRVKDEEDIKAVSSGAILSDYQRIRVENVCSRLGLVSLSYLWRRDQEQLLKEMIECSVNAVIIKVASLGLEPRHLGKSISEMQPHLAKMKEKYGLNICGEGGEYETFTLDCPLYIKSIVIDEYESVVHSNDEVAPVGYLNFKKIHLQNKNSGIENLTLQERLKNVAVKAPLDYISEIVGPDLQDGCNLSDDENDEQEKDYKDLQMTNCGQINLPSAMEVTYKKEEYPDRPRMSKNQTGWYWFGNIVGKNPEPKLAMAEALDRLIDLVKKESLEVSDLVAVTMFLKDLSSYSDINEVYVSKLAKVNPPVRVCTEVPININFHVVLDALAYRKIEKEEEKSDKKIPKRHTMHVQSISHWAPANIGPYSQAVRVGDIISVAGQIPLVPGNMSILDSNIKRQCRLTLRHINRIVKAMDSNTELRHIVQGICFLTHPNFIPAARREWEKRTNNAIVDYVVVSRLPRDAQVEWCVWAHRDNNRFEYEETGKCVGNFKVAIRRRWNYENNVSAIVCYLSTGSSNSTGNLTTDNANVSSADFTLPELIEAFEYLLCKLTKGSQSQSPPCHLRIFYKVGSLSGPAFIQQALDQFSGHNLVATIIPTRHLHNFSTFLSVCGIRHE
ncbi:diphthine--ammonia ligase [Copidosoma floridanum]|uniref:diphthine--ammonia ligase n=1 Tax=Copidosoma floridanum TaxID=29053 RepID=UPI0006C96413|nr:diphthine--ammonia ligase [Copidosoma floridanum]XP_014218145.1 diphthine--ammonia ligase [Copidosoma floridanum]XP_014218146.1 diphthine--ammonia ligase [Copidosoma floridanum]XP_014218147.1 diphthine--ammonia ligase [Copidosoma floridanum]